MRSAGSRSRRFKLVNDSLGHRAGDELINEVRGRLSGVVAQRGHRRALGGDEFVLIVKSTCGKQDAVDLAQRAITACRSRSRFGRRPAQLEQHRHRLLSDRWRVGRKLIAHADAAMYCAKQRGRNNGSASSPHGQGTRERVKLESELHEALARQQFELHYQPRSIPRPSTCTAPKRSYAAPSERGMIMPNDFIRWRRSAG